jgi:NAD(P)-dependent dehydrogenase (short-subunit alcohol dehydrogenase family)
VDKPEHTIVITGGNTGIGLACARAVAAAYPRAHLVLACRDPRRGSAAAQALGPGRAEAMELDLASLASVRAFAARVAARVAADARPPLRALVCNAGTQVVSGTRYTADGVELTFGVNHLGHFLLANLLLARMDAGRIVFVASGTHDPARRTGMPAPHPRTAEQLAYPERDPDPREAGEAAAIVGRRRYTSSKLCNVMCGYEMHRRLRAAGRGEGARAVTCNVFDPGAVPGTGLARDRPAPMRFGWNVVGRALVPALRAAGLPFSTPARSGRGLARLAADPAMDGVSGRYWEIDHEARSSEASYDEARARALWDDSARLAGIRADEAPLAFAA